MSSFANAVDDDAPSTADPLTPEQQKKVDQAWKLAQFRVKRLEAEYAACLAAEGRLAGSEEVVASENVLVDTSQPNSATCAEGGVDVVAGTHELSGYSQLLPEEGEATSAVETTDEDVDATFGEFQFAEFPAEPRVLQTAPNEEIMKVMAEMSWRPKKAPGRIP
jgi:hypothetical protein